MVCFQVYLEILLVNRYDEKKSQSRTNKYFQWKTFR